MSGSNTYKKISDHEIEIDGVIYTDGGGAPTNGSAPLYPTEGTPPTGTGTEGSATPPPYVYTPGSAAPTTGDAMDYATWLQGSTKYQAEQDRIRVEKAAETDRQKQILDANNAYRTGLATYGAKAEKMASMGLSNSGYGEYLTGKAYATQRGEVQNANRTAQQRIDQALYEEGKIQQQADAKYAEDLIGIKNQQNVDYGSLYDSALKGASIESIMQDSRWGTLTDEQRATIKTVTTQNSIKIRIDNGESLETIIADPASGWNDLTVDQQNTLNTYSTSKTEAKNAEIASNFDSFLTAINNGSATLADIQALPGWSDMVGTAYETQLQAAWDKRENGNKFNELLRNVQNGDLTAKTLQQHADWALMDETQRDQLLDAAKAYSDKNDEEEDFSLLVESLIEKYSDEWDSVADVKQTLYGLGYTKDERDSIVASWQEKNLEMFKSMSVLSQTTIDDAVKNGLVSPEGAKTLKPTATTDKDALQSGKISSESYIEGADSKSASVVNGGWSITGLGTGKKEGKGDHFELNLGFENEIGLGNGSENKATYKLVTDGVITDQQKIKQLNALATGNANQTPSAQNDSWLGGLHSSIENSGKIVVYEGALYIYTKKGWCNVAGDKINVNDAVADFLSRRK